MKIMAHLTCVGAERLGPADHLDRLRDAGIDNILTLRGDMADRDPADIWRGFHYASDLVEFVREGEPIWAWPLPAIPTPTRNPRPSTTAFAGPATSSTRTRTSLQRLAAILSALYRSGASESRI
ncbi:methylenetetrahydrofolate reductase [Desulfovibrio sp. Huiquan2017]|uniref:methylenetetrahydrofolate reductase n=1 Tax=Desulfovibrio sp. Huiquan2017 TaxID=2816861 RepID=UPI001A9102F3